MTREKGNLLLLYFVSPSVTLLGTLAATMSPTRERRTVKASQGEGDLQDQAILLEPTGEKSNLRLPTTTGFPLLSTTGEDVGEIGGGGGAAEP